MGRYSGGVAMGWHQMTDSEQRTLVEVGSSDIIVSLLLYILTRE
jgi:hypothetical protein